MRNIVVLVLFIISSNFFGQTVNVTNLKKQLAESKNSVDKINILINISKEYRSNSFKLSEQYVKQAEEIAISINNDSLLIKIYRIIGGIKQYKGDLDSSIYYFSKSLEYSKKIKSELEIAKSSSNLGSIYALDNQLDKAREILLSSITIIENYNDTSSALQVYNNLGMVYRLTHEFDKSIKYYKKAIEYTKINTVDYGTRLSNLAEAYFYSNKINKAIDLYKNAIEIFENNESKYNIGITYERMSFLYYEQNDNELAKLYALQALTIAKKIDAKELAYHSYKMLINIERSQGNLKQALNYYDKYNALSDTLNLIKKNKLLNELKVQYKVELKDIELKKQEVEIKNKTRFLYILIGGILLSIIFIVFILLQLKRINKAYNDLATQNMNAVTAEEELIELKQQITGISQIPEPNDNNESSKLIKSIINLIEKEKVYLDSNLTIFKFADDLGTNKTYVSQEINTHFNKNFSNFINDYRVAEARKLMTMPEYYNLTLAAIAKKAGFNSVSVFNRSFKRVTGITPSFYLKSVKNK